jgi:hypothetical protein
MRFDVGAPRNGERTYLDAQTCRHGVEAEPG